MFRLIYPDLSRFHCNPHKNGGLRRLLVLCAFLIVLVYGLQSFLISRSDALTEGSSTDSAVGSRAGVGVPSGFAEKDAFPADRCKVYSFTDPCEEPYFPYRMSVGVGDRAPQICWNQQDIPLKTSKQGSVTVLELALENGSVLSEKSFTADSPKSMSLILAQLRNARNSSYIIMVTWNGVPFSPTLSSHLKLAGTLINPKFHGLIVQFFLLGQKGLLPGRGISDVQLFNASPPLDQSGCVPPLASSLGNDVDHEFVNSNPGYLISGEFKHGSSVPNCGMPKPCEGEMLPIHVYTGRDHNDPPKLCVAGLYVFENKINNGGRGINIVVLQGATGDVMRVANYDTWGSDSTMLEVFLEDLQPEEIAVIFTHDEASTKLSELSRTILFELGSSRIHDLKFRAAWYMVAQKGIRGFTAFEKLNIGEKTNWADVIDQKICIPRRLVGYQTRPDPIPETRNLQRLTFCNKYSGYGDFCSQGNILASLVPAKLADVTLVNSPVYSDLTAMVVMASESKNMLRMLLETLLGQPGVNPRQVRVAARGKNDTETKELVDLFNFRLFTPTVSFRSEYPKFLARVIKETLDEYRPRYIIVIEENTVLSPDFLHYFASMEPVFEVDPTIAAIGAWNDNGYMGSSGDLSRVYRVEGFPHQAFLTTRSFWDANSNDDRCCTAKTWEGWFADRPVISAIPDVSRIVKIPPQQFDDNVVRELFSRPREFSRQSETKIENTFPVIKDRYDAFLTATIAKAAKFYPKPSDLCDSSKTFVNNAAKESPVALMADPNGFTDQTWYQLCNCFGLFAVNGIRPRGRYNETLSFTTVNQRLIVLVAPSSPYYSAAT